MVHYYFYLDCIYVLRRNRLIILYLRLCYHIDIWLLWWGSLLCIVDGFIMILCPLVWMCLGRVMILSRLLLRRLYLKLAKSVFILLGLILYGQLLRIISILLTAWKWKFLSSLLLFIWLWESLSKLEMLYILVDIFNLYSSLSLSSPLWLVSLPIWISWLYINGSYLGTQLLFLKLHQLSLLWLICHWKWVKLMTAVVAGRCGELQATQVKIIYNLFYWLLLQ